MSEGRRHDRADDEAERRKTRTLAVGPWMRRVLVTGATAATLSVPMMTWHALKTMWLVGAMRIDYNAIMKQNVVLQIQTHRITDALNDMRKPLNLAPIPNEPLVLPPDIEAALALRPAPPPVMPDPVAWLFRHEPVAIPEPSTLVKASSRSTLGAAN